VRSYEFVRRLVSGLAQTPSDVELLEGVETGEDTGAGDAAKNVGAGTLHHGHEALVLQDLNGAVDGALVLDGGAGGHHHTTTNGVDGVGHQSGRNGDAVTQAEGQEQTGVGPQQDRLQRIVETEVHATIDENADARDDESTVETLDAVGLEGLGVDVDETLVLTLAAFALGVVGQTRTGVVERVDEEKRERTGATAGQDVGRELLDVGSVLGNVEHGFDLILEGEVERLRWEVTQAVGQVTAPQRIDALAGHGSLHAIDDAVVRFVQPPLTNHLILILDEQLDALDRRGGRLGDDGGDSRKGEILRETQFLIRHLCILTLPLLNLLLLLLCSLVYFGKLKIVCKILNKDLSEEKDLYFKQIETTQL